MRWKRIGVICALALGLSCGDEFTNTADFGLPADTGAADGVTDTVGSDAAPGTLELVSGGISTLGGISMVYYVGYMVGKSRMSHLLEREVSIFGTMTGTLTTGLTLNRIVDPQFRSPAPEALLFGGGITLPMSIPYILSSLLVIHGHTQANPDAHYAIVIGLTALYTLLLFALWRWFVVPRTDDQG